MPQQISRRYHRNSNPIYWKTAEFALRRLRDLDSRGWKYIESLETYNEKNDYIRRTYSIPNAFQMTAFLWRLLERTILTRLSLRLTRRFEQWFVAIRKRSPDRSFDNDRGLRNRSSAHGQVLR